MIRGALIAFAAIALTACGKGGDAAEITENAPKALGQMPIERTAPNIGVMHLPNVDSYCGFFPEGHTFDFNDPETWKFVFVTQFDASDRGPDDLDGLIDLNGKQRRVELITAERTETGETRQYRTVDAPAYVLEIDMMSGEQGLESTDYTGTLQVTVPESGEPVSFWGDCGV